MKKAEKEYYNEIFEKHKHDSKETWKIINGVVNRRKKQAVLVKKFKNGNGKTITDPQEICHILNSHSVNNGPKLANTLPKTDLPANYFLTDPVIESFVMHPTDPHEIATIIDKLKIGKAPGPDRIGTKTIISGKSAISNILSGLINQSILAGSYPDSLKSKKKKKGIIQTIIDLFHLFQVWPRYTKKFFTIGL